MLKKLLCLACSVSLACAVVSAPAAVAMPGYAWDDDGVVYGTDDFDSGATYKLAVGGTLEVPDGYTLAFSDSNVASYDESTHRITGLAAGTTTVTYTEETRPDEWYWQDPDDLETGSFTLEVISFASLQNTSYRTAISGSDNWWGESSVELKVPVKGISAGDEDGIRLLDEPSHVELAKIEDGQLELEFYQAGTYHLSLGIFGAPVHITVKVVEVSLNESTLVLHKGKTATLKVKNGRNPSFKSENDLVATVSKSGKVTPKQLGNCKISVSSDGITLTCSVGVTSKKAYQAVQNAKADLKKKYKYSQSKRMSKNYRDCSSFVSRCYWDGSLGRRIYAIGGSTGKTWALPAAEQAEWLNRQGKRVSYKAVSSDQLLPGDTIYYQTGYAGTNSRYRHIDHAAIYVGGGLALNTGGWGGKGTVGYRNYDSGYVKFIGRPISAFTLNKSSVTLKEGRSSQLRALLAKGKVSYKTSKAGVATVSGSGRVTAKSAGTCTVTAKCKAGTYRCKVVVE